MASDRQQRARILIVEDEALLAHALEDILVSAGFEVAGVATRLAKALELIESVACDAAVIDANLAGVSAGPAASALAARGVPFIVMTGYSPEQLQGDFPGAHVIQKPARPALVIEALRTVLAKR